ncbi:hypothetical protein T4D_10678 [Trichinella pseudospiralis]|uniref:Uncharacterized protein n=1 Tax=Trichinella pseudospiralis TaxID=6337 RepID=A0A0V1FWY9_TRIPS|nr:hypothetical protein T4D_10678 [Trichinella pseudospiralis]
MLGLVILLEFLCNSDVVNWCKCKGTESLNWKMEANSTDKKREKFLRKSGSLIKAVDKVHLTSSTECNM